MARASKPASETDKAAKPKTTRTAATKATAATDKQDAGAKAPVSLPADTAPAGSSPTAPVSTATPTGAAQGSQGDGQPEPNGESQAPTESLTPHADVTADATEKPAPVEPECLVPPGGFFSPMGRFPEGWKPAQTTPQKGVEEAVQSPAWGLPDISEFPAELTLTNNTRNRVVVRHLNVHLPQFSSKKVICPTAEKYSAIQREFAGRAVRERWDSDKGLQVKYGED